MLFSNSTSIPDLARSSEKLTRYAHGLVEHFVHKRCTYIYLEVVQRTRSLIASVYGTTTALRPRQEHSYDAVLSPATQQRLTQASPFQRNLHNSAFCSRQARKYHFTSQLQLNTTVWPCYKRNTRINNVPHGRTALIQRLLRSSHLTSTRTVPKLLAHNSAQNA